MLPIEFHSWLNEELPICDRAADTVTDLVNVERGGNILQDAILPS